MSSLVSNPSVAAQWRAVRRLYPIYAALADRFDLGTAPYEDLQQPTGESESEVIARVQAWLAEMDERIQPHQFRQMLQSSGFANAEDKLHALVLRHLGKPGRNEADRDKLDFLLTQYLAIATPPSFHGRDLSLEDVALVLEPILGDCQAAASKWNEPVERLIAQMHECQSLEQFESLDLVLRGRELKTSAGEEFFSASSLLVFTRFSYFVRCTYGRLLAALAHSIETDLGELEENGIRAIDGTEIGLPRDEPLGTIREMLRAAVNTSAPAYSGDNTAKRLKTLRAMVQRTLPRNQSALTAADRSRLEQVESEVGSLRSEIAQLRELYAQFRAVLAERAGQLIPPEIARAPSSTAPAAHGHAPEFDLTSEAVSIAQERLTSPAPPSEPVAPVAAATIQGAEVASADAATTIPAEAAQPAQPAAAGASPPANGAGSGAAAAVDIKAEVAECLARIRKALRAPGSKPTGVLRIRTGTVLLTEGELQSLQSNDDGNDAVSKIVETAIGTRALLVEKCELGKAGQAVDFTPVMQLARDLHGDLQKLAGERGPKHETVSGSARQLWSVLQQAERTARQLRSTSNGA